MSKVWDQRGMPASEYSYDSECEALAKHFLTEWEAKPQNAEKDLAQAIQDAVETWFDANTNYSALG